MLRPEHYADANAVGSAAHLGRTPLVQRFGELLRKMWNPRNFKAHVSPHELLQAVSAASSKRFRIGAYADPIDFLKWFLNELHKDLGGTRARNSSIVYAALQGELRVTTFTPQRKPAVVLTNAETGVATEALGLDKGNANDLTDVAFAESTAAVPFLTLELDIPPPPLFKDELQGNVIPQVPLQVPLQKFDGVTTKKFLNGERRCYALTRLPPFLIMHLNRFTKNNFFTEKNPTIVNFPIRNLDLFDYLTPELKARVLVEREYDEAVESGTVGDRKPPPTPRFGSTRYDLVANIRHEGKPGEGTYK
jgi:U4/U6.U5 tri-snRNP-associated protein 2